MSTLSQFVGGGSEPLGSLTTQFTPASPALMESRGEYYVRTGTSITGVDDETMSKIIAKSTDFAMPGPANTFGASNISYGNGVYVQSSLTGIFRSTDGITWYPVKLSSAATGINGATLAVPQGGVAFGNGVFVAVASASGQGAGADSSRRIIVFYSSDAITWKSSSFSIPEATVDSQFLAQPALMFNSTSGLFFITAKIFNTATSAMFDFIFYGASGDQWQQVAAVNSTLQNSITSPWTIVDGGGIYVAMTRYQSANLSANPYYSTSTNGTVWTQRSVTAFLASGVASLKYLNGNFVACTSNNSVSTQIYTSNNGTSWSPRSTVGAGVSMHDSAFGAGLYVAVGINGTVITSPDLATWTSRTSTTAQTISAVEYDATLGLFIAVHVTGFITSPDGITWTPRASQLGGRSASYVSLSPVLVKVNSTWHAILNSGIATSSDGTTWTPFTNSTVGVSTSLNGNVSENDYAPSGLMSAGEFTWVCHSTGGISRISSDNGVRLVNNSATIFNAVAYGAGLYVAVGASGSIITSPDGLTWTPRTSGTATTLTAVAWSGAEFVTVGSSYGARSTDGITWTATGQGGIYLCYSNGAFYTSNGSSAVLKSTTGTSGTWISRTVSHNRMKPVSAGVVVYGAGASGMFLYAGNLITLGTSVFTYSSVVEVDNQIYSVPSGSSQCLIVDLETMVTTINSFDSTANDEFSLAGTPLGFTSLSGALIKVGNTITNSSSVMHRISNWVSTLSMPALSSAHTLVDHGTSCWVVNSSGQLIWSPKTSLTSASLRISPYTTNGTQFTTASGNYSTHAIAYRKIT